MLLLHRLQVYPLHSTVTLEEQNGVFLFPVPGYRKVKTVLTDLLFVFSVLAVLIISLSSQVILSTNIAESSVTVPDVKYGGFFCSAFYLSFIWLLFT